MNDMWELARRNADFLRLSTLFAAKHVVQYLSDEASTGRCIEWCRRHGITHVYLESFRGEFVPPRDVIVSARDRFRESGFMVSGCMTPSSFGKRGTGWAPFSCFTAQETRSKLKAMSQDAAGLFDVVMIDDFLCSDCSCDECRVARGNRSWSDYKRQLMLELSRTHIIEAGRAVNPDVEFIIKYPAWHEIYQERGYDTAAQSKLFPRTWAGTETRGLDPEDMAEGGRIHHPDDPHYRAYWLLRWLKSIGGRKCGGGWYDPYDTGPKHYVEQGRQTVLADPGEILLFSFGLLYEQAGVSCPRGPKNLAAVMEEMPQHFELARLVHGRRPRGLLGWKPPNSMPGPDRDLHPLLGVAGFPLTAAHEFDPDAPGFVFGYHVLHDPGWWDAVECAMASGRPILVTPAFMATVRPMAEGNRLDMDRLREQAIVLPEITDRCFWHAMEEMPTGQLSELRNRACAGLGLKFHAPNGVSIYPFEGGVIAIENFRNDTVDCRLSLDGWSDAEPAVCIPQAAAFRIRTDGSMAIQMPPRSLLSLRRK